VKNKIIIALYAVQTAFYWGKEPSVPLLVYFLLVEYVLMAVVYMFLQLRKDRLPQNFFAGIIGLILNVVLFLGLGYSVWVKMKGLTFSETQNISFFDIYEGYHLVMLVGLVTISVAFFLELREIEKVRREDFIMGEFVYQALTLLLVPCVGLFVLDYTDNNFIVLTWMILTRISFELFSMQRHKKAKIGIKT
jgi:hypothetical protein